MVDLTKRAALLPSFLEGSETLFIGQGNGIAFVDFGHLNSPAVRVSANRSAVRSLGFQQISVVFAGAGR